MRLSESLVGGGRLEARAVVAPGVAAGGRTDEGAGGSDGSLGSEAGPRREARARTRAEPRIRVLSAHSWARRKDWERKSARDGARGGAGAGRVVPGTAQSGGGPDDHGPA